MDAKTLLFVGLGGDAGRSTPSTRVPRRVRRCRRALQTAIGFVTAFFDTLGIGSFATTTAVYKLRNMVPVKLIPGTLNVGHALSTIAQAFIYTQHRAGRLDDAGADDCRRRSPASWLGAGVVVHWPRRKIQIGMGIALLGAAALMLMTALNLFPGGGDTLGLDRRAARHRPGRQLRARRADDARHRPLRAVHDSRHLLGMNPTAAFPIMMGSCAFLMPISSVRFVKTRTYHVQAALGLALGGLPAVLIAALIVQVAAARRGPLAGRRRGRSTRR